MKRGDTVKITATVEQLQQMGIDIDITREGEFMETYPDRWSKVKVTTDGVTHFWDIRDIYLEKKEEETVEEKDNSKGEVLEFARWCLLKKHVGRPYNWLNIEELYEIYNEERTVNTDMDSWKDRPIREVKRYFEKDLEEAWNASDRNMHNTFSSSAYKQIKFKEWLETYEKEV